MRIAFVWASINTHKHFRISYFDPRSRQSRWPRSEKLVPLNKQPGSKHDFLSKLPLRAKKGELQWA